MRRLRWQRNWWIRTLLYMVMLVSIRGVARLARAQPDPNQPAKATNPTAPERPPVWDTLTPQQRHEYKQRHFALALRRELDANGVQDAATQDAILSFVREREDACQPLRDQALKIVKLLRARAADAEINDAMADFHHSVGVEKENRDEALSQLDATIHYSKQPRLQALLMSLGIVSDDFNYLLNRALYMREEVPQAILYN